MPDTAAQSGADLDEPQRGRGRFCPRCGQRMRVTAVWRRALYNDPDRGTYREGRATCPDGHGPFIGWTTNLEDDEPTVWLEWIEESNTVHADDCGCRWCQGKPVRRGRSG